jgi:hypothetical protein
MTRWPNWERDVNWGRIPERMRGGVVRYIKCGIPPGDFLQALFKNDLMEAFARADDENQRLMGDYARLLYNELPRGSFGSVANYDAWVGHRGLGVLPTDAELAS